MRCLFPFLWLVACGPKAPPEPVAPTWGWQDGVHGACWVPETFENPTPEDLAAGRRETVDQMALQWRGGRNDGVDFGIELAGQLRGLLRQKPERIDEILAVNHEYCLEWATEGVNTMAWGGWLQGLPELLTAGDCVARVDEPWFGGLAVDRGWQHEVELCPGEKVALSATVSSRYALGPRGPIITVAGRADSVPPEGAPCVQEDCLWGVLLGRFETREGSVTVFVIGTGTEFMAPDEGVLSFGVNDDTLRDNVWAIQDGVQDGASIGVRHLE